MRTRHFYIIALSLALYCLAPAAENIRQFWASPTAVLDRIRGQMNAPEADHGHNRPLADDIQKVAYAINQEIMAADSPNWTTPSPERKAVIEKWGNVLKGYTADFVKLALDKETRGTGAGKQSRSLLDFASPTEEFAAEVRNYLGVSKLDDLTHVADLLYEHRLLSESDKDVLRQSMTQVQTEEEKIRFAQALHDYGVSDWDAYLIERAMSVLKSMPPSNAPEDIVLFYRLALGTAGELGTAASVLLPEIEAQIENPVIKASGYLAHFERARDFVSGKQQRQGRVAKNGSGPLSPWLKPIDSSPTSRPEKSEANPSPLAHPPSTLKAPEATPATVKPNEEPRSSTSLLVVAVLIVAVSGLLWLARRIHKEDRGQL